MALKADYRNDPLCHRVMALQTQTQDVLRQLDNARIWIQPTQGPAHEGEAARRALHKSLAALSYDEVDTDGRHTLRCVGVVAVADPAHLQAVARLNTLREALKPLTQALAQGDDGFDPALRRQRLRDRGLARLNILQSVRQIPLLYQNVKSISFTRAHTRSIKKVTVDQALALLNPESPVYFQQRDRILGVGRALAIARPVQEHIRANVVFENGRRKMINAPLPVVLPGSVLPKIRPLPEAQDSRRRRRDAKLEEAPLIPELHLYAYR